MISSIYTGSTTLPPEVKSGLDREIDRAVRQNTRIKIFFRADDIGPPSHNYTRMMELFIKYRAPLCLAVVPTWLTMSRWEAMAGFVQRADDLFCWHMHGYRHKNYEIEGKKQEFGPARSEVAVFSDISRGWQRLSAIIGERFTPVFTPPWNRCSKDAMVQLERVGFKAVSRSVGAVPPPQKGFADLPVHIDLHTRKEKDAQTGWENLLNEFRTRISEQPCGIMLHHMRMNDAAFVFLEYLLEQVSGKDGIRIVTYRDLI